MLIKTATGENFNKVWDKEEKSDWPIETNERQNKVIRFFSSVVAPQDELLA